MQNSDNHSATVSGYKCKRKYFQTIISAKIFCSISSTCYRPMFSNGSVKLNVDT